MNPPLVYILVINWNGMEHLHACFHSLLQNDYANFRVVLLDNASKDESVAYVREQFGGDKRVLVWALPRNLGWSGGNNEGMRRAIDAGADYVFLLNNDTWTAPDAITLLADAAELDHSIAALAPRMVLFDTPSVLNSTGLVVSRVGACWDEHMGRADAPDLCKAKPVLGVCGGAMFLRTSALRACGLLDEAFDIYYDDADLCLRFWQAGLKCFSCPDSVVRHKFSASFSTPERQRQKVYLSERNRLRFLFLNFPTGLLLRFAGLLLLAEVRIAGSALRSRQFWRIGVQMRAWLAVARQAAGILRLRKGRMNSQYSSLLASLLIPAPMFCPEQTLPDHGAYPAETHAGETRYPLAPKFRAWAAYPETHVALYTADGDTMYEGALMDCPCYHQGAFRFSSTGLLTAEASGRAFDVGGFIALRSPAGETLEPWQVFFPLNDAT